MFKRKPDAADPSDEPSATPSWDPQSLLRKLKEKQTHLVDPPMQGKDVPPKDEESDGILKSSLDEPEAPPNIFFQNARYSGMAPSPDRLPAHQRLPSTIYFFVRVTDTDAVSLVKPLASHIVAKMHRATVVEGRESAGPTAYVEFNDKSVLGLHPSRQSYVRELHTMQLVIEVPSHSAFPKQAASVEPTSINFQPYQSSSRHGDWLPRINVPVRCGLPKKQKPTLKLDKILAGEGGVGDAAATKPRPQPAADGKLREQEEGVSVDNSSATDGIGNPYAPSSSSIAQTSRAAQISERRLKASAKRANTVRLLTAQGSLIMPPYKPTSKGVHTERPGGGMPNASARSMSISARSSNSTTLSVRGPCSSDRPASPTREKFWPREFVANEMYVERLEERAEVEKSTPPVETETPTKPTHVPAYVRERRQSLASLDQFAV